MTTILEKYAHLLVNYCVSLQAGEKLFVRSTTLAEPLVREVYRAALKVGGIVEVSLDFREKNRILMLEASGDDQLSYVPLQYRTAVQEFDAFLYIRAPFNLRDNHQLFPEKLEKQNKAYAPYQRIYFERTGDRRLKRSLCQYPTQANAQEAGMSLEEYEQFVFNACSLYEDDPIQAWLTVRANQQKIVDHLNNTTFVEYKGDGIDLSFSTTGRTWINSDGQTNMPSGEVYTSPVEDSVNGTVRFSLPALYQGQEAENVTLWVKDGYIEKWEASKGKSYLDHIFSIAGARRFGEAAIGTNYNIDRITRNILFDEKIGGTVHLAIGQSYLQCGGKNESAIHWDMITSMKNGGQIYADGERIYEDGQFLIP